VPTRAVVDLPAFSARAGGDRQDADWLTPEAVDKRIREAVDAIPDGVADRVVRLVITEIPRDLFRQLDHRQIRSIKAEALHFQLEARRPATARAAGSGGQRPRTLEEEVQRFLSEWEPLTDGIERDRLLALAAEYVGAASPTTAGVAEAGKGDSGRAEVGQAAVGEVDAV
jgi:hypothetical protein